MQIIMGWYTYDVHFEGGVGGVRQKWDVIGRNGGGEVSECSGRPIFIFLIKENWILAMTNFVWNWTSKVKGVEEFWTLLDKGLGSLQNWPIFMDVICESFLNLKQSKADFLT